MEHCARVWGSAGILLVLGFWTVGIPAVLGAGGVQPPSGAVEERIFEVLSEMRRTGGTYLSISENTGRMLRVLAESVNAQEVVEIGTSTGYSGLWLGMALVKTGGRLTTFELDPGRAARARENFRQARIGHLVEVVEGNAHITTQRLQQPIDILFLDADKGGYLDYLRKLLPLVRPGGLIIADNIDMAPDYEQAVTTDPDLETLYWREAGQVSVTLKKR
jgi:caffeoyl-CoA O-methyltransferase